MDDRIVEEHLVVAPLRLRPIELALRRIESRLRRLHLSFGGESAPASRPLPVAPPTPGGFGHLIQARELQMRYFLCASTRSKSFRTRPPAPWRLLSRPGPRPTAFEVRESPARPWPRRLVHACRNRRSVCVRNRILWHIHRSAGREPIRKKPSGFSAYSSGLPLPRQFRVWVRLFGCAAPLPPHETRIPAYPAAITTVQREFRNACSEASE